MSRQRPQDPGASSAMAPPNESVAGLGVRILVADGHALGRMGLAGILGAQPGFEIVGEAGTIEETVERCRASRPDVLLLSLDLHGQDREEALPAIRRALPALRIVALSVRSSEDCLILNPPFRRPTSMVLSQACDGGTDCLHLAMTQGAMATNTPFIDPSPGPPPVPAGGDAESPGTTRA